LIEKYEWKDFLKDSGTDRSIILKRILRKYGGRKQLGLVWLGIGTTG
jgi:hypothetical protein